MSYHRLIITLKYLQPIHFLAPRSPAPGDGAQSVIHHPHCLQQPPPLECCGLVAACSATACALVEPRACPPPVARPPAAPTASARKAPRRRRTKHARIERRACHCPLLGHRSPPLRPPLGRRPELLPSSSAQPQRPASPQTPPFERRPQLASPAGDLGSPHASSPRTSRQVGLGLLRTATSSRRPSASQVCHRSPVRRGWGWSAGCRSQIRRFAPISFHCSRLFQFKKILYMMLLLTALLFIVVDAYSSTGPYHQFLFSICIRRCCKRQIYVSLIFCSMEQNYFSFGLCLSTIILASPSFIKLFHMTY